MRKLLSLILLLATLLTFSACGGDDKDDNILNNEPEAPAMPTNQFIGSWKGTSGSGSSREEIFMDIYENNTLKYDIIYYDYDKPKGVSTFDYNYIIDKNSDAEDIICFGMGRFRCEGRLVRNMLVFTEIYENKEADILTQELWTMMTRYVPEQ